MTETETQKAGEAIPELIVELIRTSSRDGRILAEDEILNPLIDRQLFTLNTEGESRALQEILRELIEGHPDLEEIAKGGMRCFYSSQFMTPAYAGIMLRKRIGRLPLIAEAVRESSEINQRPVPLSSFIRHPFDLTREEILDSLDAMATAEGYGDIARAVTSASGVYLYSTHHLEPDHAAVLAEWLDVGQFDNP
ncbi:MAG: hypothetical protein PHN75_14775 [Syntrophales bacterium]|nr:hypothetical protein [Syntrophales bacterium]